VPSSESFGLGIRLKDEEYDDDDENFKEENQKIKDEYEYVKKYRNDFDKSYGQSFENVSDTFDGHASVVGSQMSQIESVTTLNMSMNRKQELLKKVGHLANINDSINAEDFAGSMVNSEINNNRILFNVLDPDKKMNEPKSYNDNRNEIYQNLCSNFQFRQDYDQKLPISKMREEIVNKINTSPFIVIQGGTGTGKTTQVPQYILDHHMAEKKVLTNLRMNT
jgi:HrpA-like RNA helicase